MASARTDATTVRRLGAYRLLRRVAIGGMAEIFEARGEDDERPLVVKVLLPQHARDRDFVRMLEHEATLQSGLDHPNLVRVIDFGVADGQAYLAMELVDGASLGEVEAMLRATGRRLPVALAVHVVAELLDALDYVHTARDGDGEPLGIVHRDVTPQNVLLSRQGEVRLGDFGIARSNVRDTRTRTGVIKGKLRYLSPEQVTGSRVDPRTDAYAAGLILFELLTGSPYIEGESEIALLRAAEAPPARRPSEVADVDPRFDAVLARVLARFPEERPSSAHAFRTALDEIANAGHLVADVADLARIVDETRAWAALQEAGEPASSALPPDVRAPHEPTKQQHGGTRSLRPPRGNAETTPAPRRAGRGRTIGGVAALLAAAGAVAAVWMRAPPPAPSPAPPADAPPRAGAAPGGSTGAPPETPTSTAHPAPSSPGSVAGNALAPSPLPNGATAGPVRSRDTAPVPSDRRHDHAHVLHAVHARASGSDASHTSAPQHGSGPAHAGAQAASPAPLAQGTSIHDTAAADTSRTDPAALETLTRRVSALRDGLAHRGIRPDDLEPPNRAGLAAVDAALARHDAEGATRQLDALEPRLAAVEVDAAFVRSKLDRVDRRIRAADRAGANTHAVQDLASSALQAFVEGRYDATNRRLNDILSRLGTRP